MSNPLLASDVMFSDLITCEPTTRLYQALNLMDEKRIRHLLVVDDGKLTGILSDRDIKKHMSAAFNTESESQQDRLSMLKTTSEVMTSSPYSARPETPLKEIVQLMVDRKFNAVPIVNLERQPVGIITSIDLLRLLLERL